MSTSSLFLCYAPIYLWICREFSRKVAIQRHKWYRSWRKPSVCGSAQSFLSVVVTPFDGQFLGLKYSFHKCWNYYWQYIQTISLNQQCFSSQKKILTYGLHHAFGRSQSRFLVSFLSIKHQLSLNRTIFILFYFALEHEKTYIFEFFFLKNYIFEFISVHADILNLTIYLIVNLWLDYNIYI